MLFSYQRGPTPHWECRWMCPHPTSGGPTTSHCASMSQTSSHTFARQKGTSARQCSRCSSGCQAGCTDSIQMHSPVRWCGRWRQTARPHWKQKKHLPQTLIPEIFVLLFYYLISDLHCCQCLWVCTYNCSKKCNNVYLLSHLWNKYCCSNPWPHIKST